MNPKRWRWKRILRWFPVIVVVLLIVLYIVVPFAVGIYVIWPADAEVGDPPAGFEAVSVTAEDGVKLEAWYAPPDNGAVIVLLAGSGGSRKNTRSYADMLVEHGFGVFALDLRGHGESDGKTNRYGWRGTPDVGAAVNFLLPRDEVKAIGGLGLSLGGEVLLGAASDYPALKAVISEGASYRSFDEYYDLPSQHPLYRNFTTRILFFSVKLLTGEEPPKPIMDSITAAESTSFLFIAAGKKEVEIDYNEMFLEAVGERGTLWVIPNAGHTQGFSRVPDEYEQRVIEFFERTLVNPA